MLYKSACQQQERLSVVQVSMSATGEAKSVVQVSMSATGGSKVLYKSACQQQETLKFNLCGVVSKTVVPPSGVGQCYPSGVARYYANRLQPVQ